MEKIADHRIKLGKNIGGCGFVVKQVLITYKTRAHAQLSVTLLPQALS